MANKANMVVDAFAAAVGGYAGGVLGVSNSVNFYRILCAYKTVHKKQLDDAHLELLDQTIDQAMAAMDAAFANE